MSRVCATAMLDWPDVAEFHFLITGNVAPANYHEDELDVRLRDVVSHGRRRVSLGAFYVRALEKDLRRDSKLWELIRAAAIEAREPVEQGNDS